MSFNDARIRLYRHIKYALTRPAPPSSSVPLEGPVVVVGSAPVSNKPLGFDEKYRVISINGSQIVSERWGVAVPDITFMMFNQIRGTNTNAVEVRRVLNGKQTGELYLLLWRDGMPALEQGLQDFDYRYRELRIIDRYQRMALIDRVCGFKTAELETESKCSNGMNAVLFALYNGAPAVILTGINPAATGHVYNEVNLPRSHTAMDLKVLHRLKEKGLPVFTADDDVARSTGIPLWQGKIPN